MPDVVYGHCMLFRCVDGREALFKSGFYQSTAWYLSMKTTFVLSRDCIDTFQMNTIPRHHELMFSPVKVYSMIAKNLKIFSYSKKTLCYKRKQLSWLIPIMQTMYYFITRSNGLYSYEYRY